MGSEKVTAPVKTNTTGHISKLEKEQRQQAKEALEKYPELSASAPSWLDEEARKEWERVVPLLKESTPVSELDTSMIASHCTLYSSIVRTTKQINEYGEVIETEHGPRQSPYFMARDKSIKEMKAVDSQLGLTPQSRARLEIHRAMNDTPKDEFEEMLEWPIKQLSMQKT